MSGGSTSAGAAPGRRTAAIRLADEAATLRAGATLAQALVALADAPTPQLPATGVHVHLIGALGAGKTTLVRGLLRAMGVSGAVKSPTYTIVEPYLLSVQSIWEACYHFDLYRVNDPEELDLLGVRDYFRERALCVFEWPDKGLGAIPPASLALHLALDDGPIIGGRQLCLEAGDACGAVLAKAVESVLVS